jgi:hypothetical protein
MSRYPPSFRLKLDHAIDADKQVISQQFRSDIKNPLFVQLGKSVLLYMDLSNGRHRYRQND